MSTQSKKSSHPLPALDYSRPAFSHPHCRAPQRRPSTKRAAVRARARCMGPQAHQRLTRLPDSHCTACTQTTACNRAGFLRLP
eukprot:10594144-Lingulodinium_polyedra.AAC.1